MQDRVIKVVIIDDHHDLNDFYSEVIADKETFEVRTATEGQTACELVRQFGPEIVIADVEKFQQRQELADVSRASGAILIWASRFQTIDFEDLPAIARILNKPFRVADVKLAIRSELHRADRGAYIKL